MHDTLLRSIGTTVTLLHDWPLFLCCIWFIVTAPICPFFVSEKGRQL